MSDRPTTLDYGDGRTDRTRWVSLRKYLSEFEANLAANELEANGIRHQIFNDTTRSTLGMYGAFVKVDLQVLSDDLERARAVLANHEAAGAGDLEPAESDDPSQTLHLPDEDGTSADWAAVSAFESAKAMHEAAMVLESAHMSVLLPRMIPRGDAPRGEGARFVLRVQADDVDRARALLRSAASEDQGDEPRCPRCGSWNVHETSYEFTNLLLGLVGRSKPATCECLKCHYVGQRSEFVTR